MTNWQTTAKTIYCDAVDDEITILVFKNSSVRCTGCKKYTEPNDFTRQLIKEKEGRLKRSLKCEGEGCARVVSYKEKILSEEAK
jgi:TATA-box binding protein (TBP) (component of TFIID and TFIIIB)